MKGHNYGLCRKCGKNHTMIVSNETRLKHRLSQVGKKNSMWKGDNVGYAALHGWVREHKLKPKLCENCNINKPYDLANISGEYKRDINDFEWICRNCHMKKDGRLTKFLKLNGKMEKSLCWNNNLPINEIKKERQKGTAIKKIARMYGVDYRTIMRRLAI